MNYLSFLVDRLPLHYYQAELLLYSLEKFTSFKKNQIIVHCTSRVEDTFLFFLKENGYAYRVVEPYLDGKYCNKLQQLPSFESLSEEDGVFLIDTDTFFLNDPILSDSNKITAKVVDGSNPPLSILCNIFTHAKLNIPKIVPTDWELEDSYTFESNFNGGFYYVPGKEVSVVNQLWRKWATWLYEHPEFFETENQSMHIDQISFSMMVEEGAFDYSMAISNNNCPIHRATKQRLFDESKEISMMHYHRSLNNFGFLETSTESNAIVNKAVEKINHAISQKKAFVFFEQFNASYIKPKEVTEKTESFEKKLLVLKKLYLSEVKIVLHAGTPKTGTTSLQFLFDNKSDELLQRGILYPKFYLNAHVPKHQWLVQLFKKNDFDTLLEYFETIFQEAKSRNSKMIFLSTEGIFNHWWDFSSEVKEVLALLAKHLDFELFITFREASEFFESFYKQNLKNPQLSSVFCYGKDFSFEEMFKDEWFIKHLDYLGFIKEVEQLLGVENIRIFEYSKEIINDIFQEINCRELLDQSEQNENLGQSSIGVELLRLLNRYNLNSEHKKEIVKTLKTMDNIFNQYSGSVPIITNEVKEKIDLLFSLQSHVLKSKYNLLY